MILTQAVHTFVGHQERIDALVSALKGQDRIGVLIMGESGFGKSALAQTALRSLGPTLRPFRISPSPALSDVPYGALARFLEPGTGPGLVTSGDVVANIQHSLTQRLGASGFRAVLVVDDAHHLDEHSARVLAQLAVLGVAKLMVVSRAKPGPPAQFLSLWGDGLLARFDVAPLTDRQAHEMSEEVLGAPLLTSASSTLSAAAGGNPIMLLALLDQARRSQQLVQRNGMWTLHNFTINADVSLTDLVRDQLLGRDQSELEVLETVALAEPIPLPRLTELAAGDLIDRLEEDHLIRISEGPRRFVRTDYPLLGEVVRRLVPVARSRRLRTRILSVMDGHESSDDQFVRFVTWSLDCGITVADEELLRAAAIANAKWESASALRAAKAVRGPEHLLRARIEMAWACFSSGDLAGAGSLLEDALDATADADTLGAAAILMAKLALRSGARPQQLQVIAREWESALPLPAGAEGQHCGPDLLRCRSLMLQGLFVEAESGLRELAVPGSNGVRLPALTMLAEVLNCTGRAAEAATIADEGLRILTAGTGQRLPYAELLEMHRNLALLSLGRVEEVAEFAAAQAGKRFSGPFFGGNSYLLEGLAAMAQGQMLRAATKLAAAVEALTASDPERLLGYALGLASYVASLTGQRELIEGYGDRLALVGYGGPQHFQLLAQAYAAAAQAAIYGASESVQTLRQLATDSRKDGASTAEKEIRELALRLGDLEQLERLEELSRSLEGAHAACLNSYVSGLLNKDPDRLVAASEQASAAGYALLAAECLGQAVFLLQSNGDRKRARAAAQLLQLRRSELDGVVTLQLGGSEDVTELTPRERDIVTMVVNGHSNREIAARSSLSIRTVEGHLYRIFAKLGINRREDLSTADVVGSRRTVSFSG